jgi:hypothetical protein
MNAIYRDGIRYDTYLAIAVAALILAYLARRVIRLASKATTDSE